MKKIELQISTEILVEAYKELKSTYKVADKYKVSATAVKRILKDVGVLRTQGDAAKERETSNLSFKRTEKHIEISKQNMKKLQDSGKCFSGNKHKVESKEKMSRAAKGRIGERNPNYIDGSYERRPRDFKIHEFTRIRNFVFNRDEYTCKYCGNIGGHMHAHHKIPFWVKKEAFLDPDNLIAVCTTCHFNYAHQGNWSKFDQTLIDDRLIKRYSLNRERLNELAGQVPEAIVRPTDIK